MPNLFEIQGGRIDPDEAALPPLRVKAWRTVVDSTLTYRLAVLVFAAFLWEITAEYIGGLLIPGFLDTTVAVWNLLLGPEIWEALYISNQALVFGFAIAVGIGIPLGLIMGRYSVAERVTDVYMNILLVTPMAALIPLLMMSLGLGLASRVVLVTLFAIVMIVVNSRAGVRQVDPSLIEMARIFGATEREVWQKILLPGAMPAIMAGIRIGLGRAITGMVVVELLMVAVGVGGMILDAKNFFKAGELYAVVVIVVLEALILIEIARAIERRLVGWAH